jgi:nicotinamide-nucleotide amidase
VGTAPGMLFNENGKIIISLPGVPNEVEYLIENQAIPRLIEQFNLAKIEHRTLITLMVPESLLSKQLEPFEASLPDNLKLAYLPSFNCVKLRLSAHGNIISSLFLDEWFIKLQTATLPHVFCTSDITPVNHISSLLLEKNISISTAESCTGGFIANQFVQTPGISKIVSGSIITYSNEAKESELNVPHNLLKEFGAVSEEVAIAMVNGVCEKFNSMLGIATTGIAGPTGGTDKKPVGTIFIAVKYLDQILVRKFRLFGNRIQFMERASNCAMAMVKEIIENVQ